MIIHGEKHMDEILRELIASGEVDSPVNDEIVKHFLSKSPARMSASAKKRAQQAFMAARFKAMARKKADLVSKTQLDTLTFGGYLTFVRSRLKATAETAANACKITEPALLGVENAAQDILKTSMKMVVDILDGFSIPLDVTTILLRNTIVATKEKGGGATVFPRADSKAQSIVGAFEAGLLAIAKSTGKTPSVAVDPNFLSKIKEELSKRGRVDLLR